MSLAADTRRAVRREPFVFEALRSGVLNYTAAARYLDVGEIEPVAVALRRYGEDLPERETSARDVRVTMQSGLGGGDDTENALLAVGGTALVPNGGSLTGVLATGAVEARALSRVLDRLTVEGVAVEAAGVAGDALVVVTGRKDGPDAVRITEQSLSAVPVPTH